MKELIVKLVQEENVYIGMFSPIREFDCVVVEINSDYITTDYFKSSILNL